MIILADTLLLLYYSSQGWSVFLINEFSINVVFPKYSKYKILENKILTFGFQLSYEI